MARSSTARARDRRPRLAVDLHLPDELIRGVTDRLDLIVTSLRAEHAQGVKIMATLKEVQGELDDIKTGIVDLKTKAAATIQAQVDEIARLQALLDAGGTITQTDLDGLDAKADEALALLAPDAPPTP